MHMPALLRIRFDLKLLCQTSIPASSVAQMHVAHELSRSGYASCALELSKAFKNEAPGGGVEPIKK